MLRTRLFSPCQATLDCTLHDAVDGIPAQAHQTSNRRGGGFLQPVNDQRLKQCSEARIGFGPRHGCRHHAVLRAFHPRHIGLQDRLVLTRIQVAPATTARVVTWRRLATGRATWLCTRFPFHVDDDLPLGHINLHIGDSPRCLNTQYPGV